MTRPFTIDEEVIRRLTLRRDLQEQQPARSRKGRLSFRLWKGLKVLGSPAPRARWS